MPTPEQSVSYDALWQPAFDPVWNRIAPFIVGPDARGNAQPCDVNEVFLNGGRGSGKSSVVSLWVWMALVNDHAKNAVVVRKVASSIRKTVFMQMVKSLRQLRMDAYWTVNKTDLTITNSRTGQRVVFVGLDDEEKVRSITTDSSGQYFSIVWFEEAKQFAGYEEILQTRASVLRGGLEQMCFLTYNPPKSAAAWVNKEARLPVPGRLVNKSTYETMPREWLGPDFFRTAEQIKAAKPKVYAHMYLGEVTGTGGLYFDNVVDEEITDEMAETFDYVVYGVDFGRNDPNVFLAGCYDEDADTLYVFDEIYETRLPYRKFGRMIREKGVLDEYVVCDCQNDAAIETLVDEDVNAVPCTKGPGTRVKGGTWLQELTKIVVDGRRCPRCLEELLLFECHQNPDGTWSDKPSGRGDHCFDALRYMTQEWWLGGRL